MASHTSKRLPNPVINFGSSTAKTVTEGGKAKEPTLAVVKEINALYQKICEIGIQAAKQALPQALRIGKLLTEQKAKLLHGDWLPWLEKNAPFSQATAKRWMALHERRSELNRSGVSDLNEAYQVLGLTNGNKKEVKPQSTDIASDAPKSDDPPKPDSWIRPDQGSPVLSDLPNPPNETGDKGPTAKNVEAAVDQLKAPSKSDVPSKQDSQPEIPIANLKKIVGELWATASRNVPPKQEIVVAELFLEMLHKKFPELKGGIK